MSFHQALTRIDDEIKHDRKRRKLLLRHQRVIENLDALLDGYTFVWSTIKYSKVLYDQPGFTADSNPCLLDLCEQVEEILSTLGPVRLASEDQPATNQRTYNFITDEVAVSLAAILLPDSALCQRKIVGFEEVEERKDVYVKTTRPIYKFEC